MDKAAKALANSEIISVSRRITTLEMKELNERQRAEHAQKMYEHLRNSLKQVEERNLELETKFAEVGLNECWVQSQNVHNIWMNLIFMFVCVGVAHKIQLGGSADGAGAQGRVGRQCQ